MSFLKLGKKLSPAGRAWKGFASSLQTNLRRLSNSKPIKRTKKRLINTILGGRRSAMYSHPPERRRKKRRALFRRGFKPVYVDQLFATASSSTTVAVTVQQAMEAAAGKGGAGGRKLELKDEGGGSGSGSSSAKPAVPWEVDQRAERFIAEFRREMSLQRERSLDEFQEMLARSA